MSKLTVLGFTLGLLMYSGTAMAADFRANLSGGDEVPTRDTKARGHAHFSLSDDGLTLSFRLNVSNIENVSAAHIHIGPEGENGPVALLLYEATSGGGRASGVIAKGTATAADLVGPLAGLTLADLVSAIEAGNAYVNVHTNDGVDPVDQGPGDFPGGEIRGQIRR